MRIYIVLCFFLACLQCKNFTIKPNKYDKYPYPNKLPWEQDYLLLSKEQKSFGKDPVNQKSGVFEYENTNNYTGPSTPFLFQDEPEANFTVEDFVDIIYGIIDGLYLYNSIDSSEECFTEIEVFVFYWYYMVVSFNESQLYEGVLNITNALGNISPMARNCDVTAAHLAEAFNDSVGNYQSLPAFYYMFKGNVVRNYTEMDATSLHLLTSLKALEWGDIFYDATHLIYLFFLQTDASENPHTTENIQKKTGDNQERKELPQAFGRKPALTYLDLYFEQEDIVGGRNHLQQMQEVDEDYIDRINKTYGRYPTDQPTYGPVHLFLEYFYEWLLGTRLLTAGQLDPCEIEVTNYSIIYHAALDTIRAGENYEEKEEGVFQLFDTFMVYTPMTIICVESGTYLVNTVTSDVYSNLASPVHIFENFLFQFFTIFSDIAASIANAFYEDYFSFWYWVGDFLYRFLVIQPPEYTITFN